MSVLDSTIIEALTFNYLSFGFFPVNHHLWTWVAVITATISFWRRIRAARLTRPTAADRITEEPPPPFELNEKPEAGTVSEITSVSAVDGDGGTKGKFTLYYEDDGGGDDNELPAAENFDGGSRPYEKHVDGWERVVTMRLGLGEMGWYGCQDLRLINGNVVRLWDGGSG